MRNQTFVHYTEITGDTLHGEKANANTNMHLMKRPLPTML